MTLESNQKDNDQRINDMFMEMDTVYQCNATSDKDRKIKIERVSNLEMEVTNLRGQGMRDNLDLQRIKKEKEQLEA